VCHRASSHRMALYELRSSGTLLPHCHLRFEFRSELLPLARHRSVASSPAMPRRQPPRRFNRVGQSIPVRTLRCDPHHIQRYRTQFTRFDLRSLKVAAMSSHIKKSSCWSFLPSHGTRLRVEAWRKLASRGRHQRRKTEVHREKKLGQLLHPWCTQRRALH
jgi:hypothetical protein